MLVFIHKEMVLILIKYFERNYKENFFKAKKDTGVF